MKIIEKEIQWNSLTQIAEDFHDQHIIFRGVVDFEYKSSDAFDTGRYQLYPQVGNFVKITAYTVNSKMQMDRVGVLEVQIAP